MQEMISTKIANGKILYIFIKKIKNVVETFTLKRKSIPIIDGFLLDGTYNAGLVQDDKNQQTLQQ